MGDLLGWVAEGRIRPPTTTAFALDDVAQAHRALETGETVGKLVLVPADRRPDVARALPPDGGDAARGSVARLHRLQEPVGVPGRSREQADEHESEGRDDEPDATAS